MSLEIDIGSVSIKEPITPSEAKPSELKQALMELYMAIKIRSSEEVSC